MIDKKNMYRELDEVAFLEKVASYRGDSLVSQNAYQQELDSQTSIVETFSVKLTQLSLDNKVQRFIPYSIVLSAMLVWATLFLQPVAAVLVSLVATPAMLLDKDSGWRYTGYLVIFFGGLFSAVALLRIILS